MPIVLVSFTMAFAALLIFRQPVMLDVLPIIIMCVTIFLVSEILISMFQEDVIKEYQKKFPNIKFTKLELEKQIIGDIPLLIYRVIYFILLAFLIYQIFVGIGNHHILIRLLLPIISLIIFDIIFVFKYCYKQVNDNDFGKVITLFFYHESLFMRTGIKGTMIVIGVIMCLPLLILSIIFSVLKSIVG